MIIQQLHDHRVVLVNQDSFYRGLTPKELANVGEYNFDHPGKVDGPLFGCCLLSHITRRIREVSTSNPRKV